jgi:tetratricopeptide (TPR) repeat protein
MNLEKLKDTARKLEQKEDWRKAIEVYLKAIQQAESGAETSPDLSLYNRVGDLYLKINDTAEAVRSYERAVDLYADQGFFNNAIALCGKILRVNPGRTQTYLKLCQLHARKNVVSEAKRNLIEFLERMNALGQLDQAFQAVKLFADQFSGSQEIRSMLVELLRATSRGDEAREQLEKMAQDLEAAGDKTAARKSRDRLHGLESEHPTTAPAVEPSARRRGDLIFLDTGVEIPTSPPQDSAPASPPHPAKEPPRPMREPPQSPPPPEPVLPEELLMEDPILSDPIVEEPLVSEGPSVEPEPVEDLILDPLLSTENTGMGADSLLGLEPTSGSEDSSFEPLPDLTGPLDIQREEPQDLDFEPMTLEGMEGTSLGMDESPLSMGETSLDDYSPGPQSESLGFSDDIMVSLPDGQTGFEAEAKPEDPVELAPDLGADSLLEGIPLVPSEGTGPDALAELENRVLDDPENPDIHLELAEKLLSLDQTDRVSMELELALAGYEDRQDWNRAAQMADRLVELSPDSVNHHQKRVELAYRMGDRAPLLEAYLGLGDALGKSGAIDKATAVYGRVIEHDPGNVRAAAALARLGVAGLAPAKPAPPPAAAPTAARPPAVAPTPAAAPAPPPPRGPVTPPPRAAAPAASAPTPAQPAPTPAPVAKAPATPAPPPPTRRPPAAEDEGFIDLGSMVRDDEDRARDTRMRVNRREPKDQDEQREFHEILEQFKRGIDENLDSDDYESHYDLGVAFKEMGLLDEAIGEFQKALRAPEGRLRTSEALGMAFFEKGQYAVCESVLRRAIEGLDGGDEAKIGLLYWLGRASEAQGKEADAIVCYERAMVVDIRFKDLSQRMQRLAAGRRR